MAELKDVIYLSNEDYNTLVTTGTVTIAGEVLTYDPNNVYITPEKLATTTEDGLMSSTDKTKLDGLSAPNNATITVQKNGVTVDSFTLNQSADKSVNISMSASDVNLGNVANTGDSAVPVQNGTTKFTTGGAYTELAKKQDTITSTNKLSASLVSGLAGVATSGSYNDLSNKPTIPTKTSDITNDSGFITKNVNDLTNYTTTTALNTALGNKVDKININSVLYGTTSTGTQASFGYSDLAISFTIPRRDLNGNINVGTPTTANNATSKQYVDNGLSAKQDTITSSNKLSAGLVSGLSTVATSGSYADLSNKPSIPTKTSDITNDSGFITKSVNNLDNYTTTDSLNTALSSKENTSNKVTSVSSSSTNEQYPSALATYTAVNNEATTRSTAVSTLQTEINNLKNIGRFLALWNASTGVPTSEPTTSPYTYRTGDYFRVTVTGTRIPTGSSYVVGGTNYTTGSATAGDVFYYDGTSWNRQEVVGNYVQDVQIGSSSIVSGGVATIQTKTAYNASTNKIATESDIPDVSGKVAGPSSSTDNAVAVYNGTGGKKVKNSPIIVDSDNGELRNGTNDFRIAVASGSSEAALKIRTTGNGAYNYYVGLNTKNLTAYRRIAFPNKDGTIALTNDIPDVSSFITKDVNNLTNYTLTSSLAAVATSGEYDDLENKPTIPTVSSSGVTDGTNTYNASDKVDKVTTAGSYGVYGISNGNQTLYNLSKLSTQLYENYIVQRDTNGVINTATPTADSHATTKAYVDSGLSGKANLSGAAFTGNVSFSVTPTVDGSAVATRTWVDNRGFLTEHQDISGKLTGTKFNTTAGGNAYASYETTGNSSPQYVCGFVNNDAFQGLTHVAVSDLKTSFGLSTVATSGSYTDLSNKPSIPTVNNPTITFTQGGATKGSFTLNQSSAATIALDAGGGGGIPETTTAGQVLKSTSTAGTVQWDTLQEATYGSNDDLVIQAAQGGGGTLYMHHVEMNLIGNGLCFDVINTDSTPITTKAQIADIFTNRKMVGPIWCGYDNADSAPFLDRKIVYDLPSSVSASAAWIYVSAGKPGSTESIEDAYVYLENIYDTVVEI